MKPRKARIRKKKVVRFVSSDPKKVVPAVSRKRISSGGAMKTPAIFEKCT
jgi:hypothetical protein